MDNENSETNTTEMNKAVPEDGFLRQVLQLLVAMFSAIVSSSFVGIVIFFMLFMIILIAGGVEGHYSIAFDKLPILFITAVFFTVAYGILVPMFSLFQVIIFGIPAVLIGWKFKVIRWWTCIVTGFFLSSFPWSLFGILFAIMQSSSGYPLQSKEIIIGIGIFLVLGLCGGVGGFALWLTLQLLRFPYIDSPKQLRLFMQGIGS